MTLTEDTKFDYETHVKNFTNYCEVIIFKDVHIEYAVPSHQDKLVNTYCKLKNIKPIQLYKEIPLAESPMYYVACKINAVVVINNYIIRPYNWTDNAKESVNKLIRTGCISNPITYQTVYLGKDNRVYNYTPEVGGWIYE